VKEIPDMDDIEKAARSRQISILLGLAFIGAIGLAARPIYRSAFAERAVRDAAIQHAMKDAKRLGNEDRLQELLATLNELEKRQRLRNPMRYGMSAEKENATKANYNSSSATFASSAKSV
jgi:hypothetical protein